MLWTNIDDSYDRMLYIRHSHESQEDVRWKPLLLKDSNSSVSILLNYRYKNPLFLPDGIDRNYPLQWSNPIIIGGKIYFNFDGCCYDTTLKFSSVIRSDDYSREYNINHYRFLIDKFSPVEKFNVMAIPIIFRKRQYIANRSKHRQKSYCLGNKHEILKILSKNIEAAYPINAEFKDIMSYDIDDCVNKSEVKNDKYTCSICTMIFKNPIKLKCGHIFCDSCISEVIKQTCPMCRRPFIMDDLSIDKISFHTLNTVIVNCKRCLNKHSINDQCFDRDPFVVCKRCTHRMPISYCRLHFVSCLMKRCEKCSLLLIIEDFLDHQLKCGKKICIHCKSYVRQLDYDNHLKSHEIVLKDFDTLLSKSKNCIQNKLKIERNNQKKEIKRRYKNMRLQQKYDKRCHQHKNNLICTKYYRSRT